MSCDFFSLATSGVSALSPYVPGKPEDELKRELGLAQITKLASNENPLGPSKKALNAIAHASSALCRYPDGSGFVLRSALAKRLDVSANQITLGNGSNDVLELIVRAFCDERSEVLFSQYAFAVYPLVTQAVGATSVVAPAVQWGHDLEAMSALISDKTKVVFIANPNNPTGTYVNTDTVVRFLDSVPANVLVVLDEAYCEYIDLADFPDGVALLAKYPNLIVTRTFSKAWGLAGLRVGYSVSHPDVANILNRVRQPFNVNALALAAATIVLEDDDYLEASVKTNNKGMRQIVDGFESLGLEYIPSVGNFICVKVGDAAGVYQKLLRSGVIVRPVANYGMPEHLRVSIGLKEENSRFLDALKAIL
ncbi:MAG: histidinol-phosphate transaminase [Hahellaceae bacterium]|nr:histidinol-phosphate transaminase [Hahellaceae bacterium]MCP5211946.1 histidinol-phosphate transaminase [Hahellaceae bacterium]